jgi:hypothetical protein
MSATQLFIEADRCYRLAHGIADPKLSRRLVHDRTSDWAALPDAAD